MKKCVLKKCRKTDRDYIKGIVEEVVKEELEKRENKTSCDELLNMTALQTCIVNALLEADRERDRLEKKAYDKAGKTLRFKVYRTIFWIGFILCLVAVPTLFVLYSARSGLVMLIATLLYFIVGRTALLLCRLTERNSVFNILAILIALSTFIFQIAYWIK